MDATIKTEAISNTPVNVFFFIRRFNTCLLFHVIADLEGQSAGQTIGIAVGVVVVVVTGVVVLMFILRRYYNIKCTIESKGMYVSLVADVNTLTDPTYRLYNFTR